MRSRVFLMVALLAVAGVMAAMAYTSVQLDNPATATIVDTENALLALSCNEGVGYQDETCSTGNGDGLMHLNFAAGLKDDDDDGDDSEPGEMTHDLAYYLDDNKWYVDVELEGEETKVVFLIDRFISPNNREVTYIQITDFKQDGYCFTLKWRYTTEYDPDENDWTMGADVYDCFREPSRSAPYGFQPGSIYTFDELVKVTNNSEDSINLWVSLTGELEENASLLGLQVTSDGVDLLNGGKVRLGSGDTLYISFSFAIPMDFADEDQYNVVFDDPDDAFSFSGTFVVQGEAVQ